MSTTTVSVFWNTNGGPEPARRPSLRRFRIIPPPGSGPPRRVDVLATGAPEALLGVAALPGERVEPLPPAPLEDLLARRVVPAGELTEALDALGSALQAGAGVDDALALVAQGSGSPALRGVIGAVRRSVQGGSGLSEAFARHPKVFPGTLVALISAGELSEGGIGPLLAELAARRRSESNLRGRILQSLGYPSVVLSMTLAATLVLQLKALPPLVENFQQLGATLPPPTRLLHAFSQFLVSHGPWLLAAGVTLAILLARPIRAWFATESMQRRLLSLPLFGPVLGGLCLVRMLNTFSLLKASGAKTAEQFELAGQASGNPVHERFCSELRRRVLAGEELHDACLAAHTLLPGDDGRILAARLRIGAFSGESGRLLSQLAAEVLARTERRAAMLPQALEIPLLLICGGIIATLILAMLMPMPSLVIDMLKRPGGF